MRPALERTRSMMARGRLHPRRWPTMRRWPARWRHLMPLAFAAVLSAAAVAQDNNSAPPFIAPPAAPGPATGLADSAALRATVFGTPPQNRAPMPNRVPLAEINIAMPWTRPVPEVLWFDRRLRVWFSAQDKPAPLAIVIAGTGSDGNTGKLSTLRAVLYGAGYHV